MNKIISKLHTIKKKKISPFVPNIVDVSLRRLAEQKKAEADRSNSPNHASLTPKKKQAQRAHYFSILVVQKARVHRYPKN